jgi:hypothetical protein
VEGSYEADWTPGAVGEYNVIYTIYSDAPHTTLADYSKELDQISVRVDTLEEIKAYVIRILGLTHENVFIDNTVYVDCGQLVSSRVRIFDSKAHADLATDGGSETLGLIATYIVTTTYEGPTYMATYKMVKL